LIRTWAGRWEGIWGRALVLRRSAAVPAWAYLALWLAALMPRLVVAHAFLDAPITLSDMLQYDMLARSIEEGRGYRWYTAADVARFSDYLSLMIDVSKIHAPPEGLLTTFRAPGYPIALSLVYALTPEARHIAAARLAQAGLMATIAPLAAAVAATAGIRCRKWVALAGVGAALYPILVFYPVALASENLFIPLTGAAYLLTLRAGRRSGWGPVVLAGAGLGAAMLTRGTLAPFVLLAGLWLHFAARRPWRDAVLLGVVAFGLCLPWSVRNSRIMGAPAFVETTVGYNLYVGYHPDGNGGFVQKVGVPPMLILDDAERDHVTRKAAIGFIRADPVEALHRVARRAAFLAGVEDREMLFFYNVGYFGEIQAPARWLLYIGLVSGWILAALLGLAGILFAPRRDAAWLAAAVVVGLAVPPLLVLAEPRFHLPLVPVLLGFAAVAMDQRHAILAALRAKGAPRRRWALLGGGAVLGLLWVWGYAMNWERLLAIMGPGGHLLLLPY
jgi:4-amino-4-deoxy-L-arabinose transferase-like glycosyltransferase